MSKSIREKIVEDIKTTLTSITIANGYQNDIQSVQRWQQSGNTLLDVPCIILNTGSEQKENLPGFITSCKLSLFLDIWTIHDEKTVHCSSDALLNSLLADVEKALMVDYQRSGYAITTRIMSSIPFETTEGQPYIGIVLSVEIEYRHSTQDPTLQ